ncbi:MAG: hypothetical protein K9J06_11305 [Flavobacteriales bacterium]|nr:hypothetical protein [Flavobacteriales bacterium]
MRRISKKEAEKLKTQLGGKRSRVRAEIESLEVGDIMLLERQDWTQATHTPTRMVQRVEIALKRKYTCGRLIDGTGWVIERKE